MSKFHQGFFKPRNPSKYDGDVRQVVYRSGWELRFMQWCDDNSRVVKWSSEEMVIPYQSPIDNKYHRYFVDFKVVFKTKVNTIETFLIEIKPYAQTIKPVAKPKKTKRKMISEVGTYLVNEAKWEAAKRFCVQKGWNFAIFTERDLPVLKG